MDSLHLDNLSAATGSPFGHATPGTFGVGSEQIFVVAGGDTDPQLQALGSLLESHALPVITLSHSQGIEELTSKLKMSLSGLPTEKYQAIHILSHGSNGEIRLGRDTLTGSSLNLLSEELADLGGLIAADGDLLIYGCSVGETQEGQAFIEELSRITGADVAASSNITGSPTTGIDQDWQLEVQQGVIEHDASEVLTSLEWRGSLPVPILASIAKVLGEAVVGAFAGYAVEQLFTVDRDTGASTTNVVLQFPEGGGVSPAPVNTGIKPGTFVKSALYLDSSGDLVDIRLSGKGEFKLALSGGLTNLADAISMELRGTDSSTNISISASPIGQAINAGSATSINEQTKEIGISGLYNRMYSPGYTTIDRIFSSGSGKIGDIELTAAIVNNIDLQTFDINSIELDAGYTPLVDRVNTTTLNSSSGIFNQLTGNTVSNNTALDGEIIDFAIIDDDPTISAGGGGNSYLPVTGLIDIGNVNAKSLERLIINGSIGASTGDSNDPSRTNDIRGVVNITGRLGNISAKRSRLDGTVQAGSIGKIDIGRIDGTVITTDATKALTLTLPAHFRGFINSAGHLNMAYTFYSVLGDPDNRSNPQGPTLGRITSGGGISGVISSETDPIFLPSGYNAIVENTSTTKGIADIRVNGALSSRWISASNIGNITANTITQEAVINASGNIGNIQAQRKVVVPKAVDDPDAQPAAIQLDGTFIAGGNIAVSDKGVIGHIRSATSIGADFRAERGSIGNITATSGGINSSLIEAGIDIGQITAQNQLLNKTKLVAQAGEIKGLKVFNGTWGGVVRAKKKIGDIYVEKGSLDRLSLASEGSVGNITVKGSNTIVGGTFTAGTTMGLVKISAARGTGIQGALFQAGDESGQFKDDEGRIQTSSIKGFDVVAHGATLLPSVDAGVVELSTQPPSQPSELAAHGMDSVQILAGKIGGIKSRAYTGSGIVGLPFNIARNPDVSPDDLVSAGFSVIHAKVEDIAGITSIGNGHGIANLIAVAERNIGSVIGLSEVKGNGIEHARINANSGKITRIEGRGGVAGGHGINDLFAKASGDIGIIKGSSNANEGDGLRFVDARAAIFGSIEAVVLGGKGGEPNRSRGSGITQSSFKGYNDTSKEFTSFADTPETEIKNPYWKRNGINSIKVDTRSIYGKGIDRSTFDVKGGIGLINSRAFANSAIFDSEFSAYEGNIAQIAAESLNAGNAIDSSLISAENGSIGSGRLGISAKSGGLTALDNAIAGSTFEASMNIGLINASSKGGSAITGTEFLADSDFDNIGSIVNIIAKTDGENLDDSAGIKSSSFTGARISRIEANVSDFDGGASIVSSNFTARTATYDERTGGINNRGVIGNIQVTNGSRIGDGITKSKFYAGAAGSIGNINVDVISSKLNKSDKEFNRVASGRAIHLSEFRASSLDPDQVSLTGTIGNIMIKAGRVEPELVPDVLLPTNSIPPNDQATIEGSGINASYFAAYGQIGNIEINSVGTGIFGSAFLSNVDPLNGVAGVLANSLAQVRGSGRLGGIKVSASGVNASGTLLSLFAGTGIGNIDISAKGFPIPNPETWLRQFANLGNLATALQSGQVLPIIQATGVQLLDFLTQPIPVSSSPVTLTGFVAIRNDIGSINIRNTSDFGNYPFLGSLIYARGSYGPVTTDPQAIKANGDRLAESLLASLGYQSPNVFTIYPLPTTFIGRSRGGNLPGPRVR